MPESTPRSRGRAFVVTACALAVAVLFGLVMGQAWQDRSTAEHRVAQERLGVAYLHSATSLVGQLVQAQTDAVRGVTVNAQSVRKALAAVSVADGKHGAALGSTQRLRDLNTRTEAAITATGTPRERYGTWTDVMALALDLIRAVGDNSGLARDEGPDSYYVAQAALVQLPDAMSQAGRAAALAALADGRQLTGDDAVRAAVARYAVASDGEQSTNGLNTSIAATDSHTLGSDIALQLDAFRSAVANFTPPTALAQSAPVDADQLAGDAKGIYDTALPLCHALLSQLDNLLRTRGRDIAGTRRNQEAASAAVALAYLIGLLAVILRRRPAGRRRSGSTDAPVSPAPVTTTGRPGRDPAFAGRTPPNHRGAT